ncbi:hypothetical protein [Dyadobacter frigoris]|uniref:Uncharacterized protein n=1 Tax=Dyadobacter frigoris TaxID=2576211 RepID=A0A4U6D5R2_9BACT|nr:hypothetical protein [Dyadobacter frigoris]TKT92662.1 hypothetical protein FDK13_07555 [Dyadobacter frigoris]
MLLPLKTQIAGNKTVQDWQAVKLILIELQENASWEKAYEEYFLTRLNDRYIRPLNSIKENGSYSGEGFSIMTILCSIIEFLESTYQGKNYKFRRRNDPGLTAYQYDSSEDIFVSFLVNRTPFNTDFNNTTSKDFYKNIRCGLLHEARTKGNWAIWGRSNSVIVEAKNGKMIIYRDNFFESIFTYLDLYKMELLASATLKSAFIRKFDNLCEE